MNDGVCDGVSHGMCEDLCHGVCVVVCDGEGFGKVWVLLIDVRTD